MHTAAIGRLLSTSLWPRFCYQQLGSQD